MNVPVVHVGMMEHVWMKLTNIAAFVKTGSKVCAEGLKSLNQGCHLNGDLFAMHYFLICLAGVHCQYDFDECSSHPCLHGGSCDDLYGKYKCSCLDGWTGGILIPVDMLHISAKH